MKLSFGAVLAFAAAVLAKPILTNSNYDVTQDVPFTLTWSNAEGPVTITLMTGTDPNNLKKVYDLTTGQTGNSFTFTPNNLPSGPYAFRITDSTGQPNYSPSFEYSGTGTLPSSTGSVTTASASSTSGSASSTTSSDSSSSSAASSSASSTGSSSSSGSSSSTSSSASSSVTSSSASSTLSTTTTGSTPSTTRAATTNTPANSNNGQRFASPLALVLVTVAALVFFN